MTEKPNQMRFAIQKWNKRFLKWTWFKWYADVKLRDASFESMTLDEYYSICYRKIN